MRRVCAIGCCLAYLAFGLVAGAAHVHEAADHHEEMRGLHLDHAHSGETPNGGTHDHHVTHHHNGPDEHHGSHDHRHAERQTGARHVEHHHGDAVYLTVAASRTVGSGPRDLPATVSIGETSDDPGSTSARLSEEQDRLRVAPQKRPTPSRAPPA